MGKSPDGATAESLAQAGGLSTAVVIAAVLGPAEAFDEYMRLAHANVATTG